jgi:hypothetical protein
MTPGRLSLIQPTGDQPDHIGNIRPALCPLVYNAKKNTNQPPVEVRAHKLIAAALARSKRPTPAAHQPALGRGAGALRTAKSVLDSSIDLPAISTVPEAPKAVDRLAIAARISALMTLAHSRGGIDPWQIAELAKLKGISPWAPLRVILGHKDGMK